MTDKDILHLSNRLTDKTKIRQLGLELGLTAHEIQKHFVTHSPDSTEAAYSMLLSWISRIEDRQVAHQKIREALKKAGLNLYNSEVLASLSQGERNSNDFQRTIVVVILTLIAIFSFFVGRNASIRF